MKHTFILFLLIILYANVKAQEAEQAGEKKDKHLPYRSYDDFSPDADSTSLFFIFKGTTDTIPEHEYIYDMAQDFDDNNVRHNIPPLLRASGDVFSSAAAFAFGAARFRPRGYDGEYQSLYINGTLMNSPETGYTSWSLWGGLNDATRNQISAPGCEPSNFGFGSIGGSSNIITRASAYRKTQRYSYALTNRAYRQRIMATYATGMMDNGWAFFANLSRRWAEEGMIEGTFYDAWGYAFSAEKKLNNRHSLNFTLMGAPTKRGMQAAATQEIYDLLDNNFYNPNWGYQNGEKRNARVRDSHAPRAFLTHYFKLTDNTLLETSVHVVREKSKTSSLNWYDAADPRPDYYRYLPSYFKNQTDIQDIIANNWMNDQAVSQIRWDDLYQVNFLSSMENKQSKYIVENRHHDKFQYNIASTLTHYMTERLKLYAGVTASHYTSNQYKTIEDLLGGNYWIDIDQFAERDFVGDTIVLQNDLNNPNRIVKENEKFGYDYEIHHRHLGIWANAVYTHSNFEAYLSANGNSERFYRKGNMMNGRYPDNSYGESDPQQFLGSGVKAGGTYKITGRHYLKAGAAYIDEPVRPGNAYLSPRIKDELLPNLKNSNILSSEISYIAVLPKVRGRLTYFNTSFKNQTEVRSFYHDEFRTYVNYILSNLDKHHQGIELGSEVKVNSQITLVMAGSFGEYRYASRPDATISVENGSIKDTTEKVYFNNFFVPGTPQLAATAGLKYFHRKFWFFNFNINYFDKSYLSYNPGRRTERAIYMLGEGDPLIADITTPEKLSGGYTLDASLGRSIRYKGNFISINLTVNNLLNNTDLRTGGFEQMRFDYINKDVDRFPPKYYYAYGRNFFLNISIRI